jgi:nucleoside-diphosphate-sugar epimerase
VINFSSIAVYPNKDGVYCEDSEILPSINNDGLYGLSKFCGENLLDFCCKGVGVVNLRISQVYSRRNDRIFEVMKRELLESNKISVYGNCNRVGNFITIDLLVEKVLFFINNDLYGVFNIGGENLSYKDLALSIINKYGNSRSIIKCVDKGVSSKMYINLNKLKNIEANNDL